MIINFNPLFKTPEVVTKPYLNEHQDVNAISSVTITTMYVNDLNMETFYRVIMLTTRIK